MVTPETLEFLQTGGAYLLLVIAVLYFYRENVKLQAKLDKEHEEDKQRT